MSSDTVMYIRSNKLLFFALFFALTSCVYAKDNVKPVKNTVQNSFGAARYDITDMFYEANAMYEYAEYNKAILEYKKIIDKGWVSGPLFYNLGNCYFKEGKLGKAIFNYDKAKRFIPRDSDLESNYKYVKSLVKGNVGGKRIGIINKLFVSFTIDELAILLSVLYLTIIFIIIASLYIGLIKRYRLFLVSILIVVFAMASMAIHSKILELGSEAVVVKENTDARFEPFVRATAHFTLYEGTKIKVLSSQGKWCKIRRWDNKTGWVKKKDIEIF